LSIPSPQDNPYPGLIEAVQRLQAQLTTAATLDTQALGQHAQHLETQRQAWLAADSGFPPSASQHEQFEALLDATYALLKGWRKLSEIDWQALAQNDAHRNGQGTSTENLTQWLKLARQAEKSVPWPAAVPVPTALADLRQDIEQAAVQQRELGQRQGALSQELSDLSATLQGLIDNGEFKKALGALGRCRKLQKQGAKGNEKLLNRISTQLGELSDWQQYAASPKRDELLQSLTAMVDTPLSAESQRERIKELRAQWNALGPLPREQLQLQQRFDELADQAFEICREHFAEQSKQRSDNLIARKALVRSAAAVFGQHRLAKGRHARRRDHHAPSKTRVASTSPLRPQGTEIGGNTL
jgi:regulator of replication initiation timing